MDRKILIMGLPGAGKTTLARILAARLNAVHFNADEVRQNVNKDLGFSEAGPDRAGAAHGLAVRPGGEDRGLCDRGFHLSDAGSPRALFCKKATRSWCGSTASIRARSRTPTGCSCRPDHGTCTSRATGSPSTGRSRSRSRLRPIFDPKKPTALFVGRYQPFHDGHKALIVEGLRRVGQACIAVRNTAGTDAKNPFEFEYVRARIEHALARVRGTLPDRAAAEHHPRLLRPRRRLCGRAD